MTPRLRTALLRIICLLMLPTLACSANPFQRTPAPEATIAPQPASVTPVAVVATAAAPVDADAPLRFTQALANDIDSFNPVLAADDSSHTVQGLLLPRLIERDAQTGAPAPTGLATGWVWSPDGAALTVTLRSDVVWSDGAPVTGRDVGFTYAALASPTVNSPLGTLVDNLRAITPVGNDTLVFALNRPDCAFLQALMLPILPSHLFAADMSDMATNGWNEAPAVGAGPFLFVARTPRESITLVRNPAWFKGAPTIETYTLRVIPDSAERLRSLLAGETDLADDLPPQAGALSGGVRVVNFLRDSYSMLAINLADPAAPQSGRSEAGSLQPQTPHPILGDLRVRRAIAQGIDTARLLRESYGGNAAPIDSWVLPTVPWAYAADLPAIPYDADAARALLDEAGWLAAEGNPIRTRGGAPLALTLTTNSDNPLRVRLAEAMRDALNALGFSITLQALPFDEASAAILAQRYDLALLGWEQVGPEPAAGPWFDSRADLPGTGVNVTSFQNPVVDTLFDAARTVPACDLQARGDLYRQIQRQVVDAAALLPLNGVVDYVGIGAAWRGINPGPWALDAGIEGWERP